MPLTTYSQTWTALAGELGTKGSVRPDDLLGRPGNNDLGIDNYDSGRIVTSGPA